jgi:hypothetical protein
MAGSTYPGTTAARDMRTREEAAWNMGLRTLFRNGLCQSFRKQWTNIAGVAQSHHFTKIIVPNCEPGKSSSGTGFHAWSVAALRDPRRHRAWNWASAP